MSRPHAPPTGLMPGSRNTGDADVPATQADADQAQGSIRLAEASFVPAEESLDARIIWPC